MELAMRKLTIILFVITILSTQIFAQRWGANVSGGYSFTVGEFKDYYNNGFHGSGAVFYNLGKDLQISLITGYSKWDLKKDYFAQKWSEEYPNEVVDVEAPVTAIPLVLGFKYFVLTSRKIKPYFMFAAGMHFLTTELSGTRTIYIQGVPVAEEDVSREKESFNETTIGFGLGLVFPFSKKVAVDVNWKYNIMNDSQAIQAIDNPADVSIQERTLSYISLMVGIDYTF